MLTLEDVVVKLKDRNLAKVAYLSGLSYGSVLRASKGSENLKYETMRKLSEYLEKQST